MKDHTRARSWFAILLSLMLFTFVFGLSACNTMEGAGEDIESAGEAIEDAAD